MFTTIWQFEVKLGCEEAFEQVYGSKGDWARLFSKGTGFVGVELLRDVQQPNTYITIDRWETADNYAAFRKERAADYKSIDNRMEAMTLRETKLGDFELV